MLYWYLYYLIEIKFKVSWQTFFYTPCLQQYPLLAVYKQEFQLELGKKV